MGTKDNVLATLCKLMWENKLVEPEKLTNSAPGNNTSLPVGAPDFHDASLFGIEVDWKSGSCRLSFRTHAYPSCALLFLDFRKALIPREMNWGISSSVMSVKRSDGVYEVEMQSGDVIIVEAASCNFLSQ